MVLKGDGERRQWNDARDDDEAQRESKWHRDGDERQRRSGNGVEERRSIVVRGISAFLGLR